MYCPDSRTTQSSTSRQIILSLGMDLQLTQILSNAESVNSSFALAEHCLNPRVLS